MLMDGSYQRPAEPGDPLGATVEEARRPGPAVFDVAPVGRRRRLPDRALIVGAAVLAVVGLAVLKPWDDPSRSTAVGPDGPVASAVVDPVVPDDGPEVLALAVDRLPAWADVATQLQPMGGWGVRTLSDPLDASTPSIGLADGSRLAVVWTPVTPQGIARVGGTMPVRMLAITTPEDDPALDVRVWQRPDWTEQPVRVPVLRLRGDPGTGEMLLVPADPADPGNVAWSPGSYRFELLLADRLAGVDVEIPGPRLSDVPLRWVADPVRTPGLPDERDRPVGQAGDAAARPIPVAVVGSVVVPVPAVLTTALGAHAAWLGARIGAKPSTTASIAPFRESRVAALGVALPPGTEVIDLRAERIGGVLGPVSTRMVVDPDGRRVVVLTPDGSGGWLPGAYRLDVTWAEPGGGQLAGAYHLDLDPGPASAVPRLLAAVRGWARHAGEQGVIVGTVEPLEGGPAAAAIRLLPQRPGAAAETVEAQGGRCAAGGVLADAIQPVIGVAHLVDASIESVTVERLFVGERVLGVPVRTVVDAVPGLVVITPVDPDGWQVGHYRIVLRGDGVELRHVVCLGPGPGSRVAVPDEASSRRAYIVESGRRRR
jgi:hypothetical protein